MASTACVVNAIKGAAATDTMLTAVEFQNPTMTIRTSAVAAARAAVTNSMTTDRSVELDGWSYVWAALGGPVYVLSKGFVGAAVVMLFVTAALAAATALVLIVIVGFWNSTAVSIVSVAAAPLIALTTQAVLAIQLVRRGFINRGWREGY